MVGLAVLWLGDCIWLLLAVTVLSRSTVHTL